jgi:NAD(P)-dependent dehydrogenase (short-subunit alcohol dehydrogenase family)
MIGLAEEIASQHGHLDVLINNAGTFERTRKTTPDGMEMMFAVNYLAPLLPYPPPSPVAEKESASRSIGYR